MLLVAGFVIVASLFALLALGGIIMELVTLAIVLIALGLAGGFWLYRHYHPTPAPAPGAPPTNWGVRVTDWMRSAWDAVRGAIGGIVGLLLTLAFVVGVALLLWVAWGFASDAVMDRIDECRNPSNPEKAIECIREEHEEDLTQEEVEYILDHPEEFLTPEATEDPK